MPWTPLRFRGECRLTGTIILRYCPKLMVNFCGDLSRDGDEGVANRGARAAAMIDMIDEKGGTKPKINE